MCKPFLNYSEQIRKLKEKGMLINDEDYAIRVLKKYSYYSLISGYKTIFKNPINKKYYYGVKIEDIVALYNFDKELRELFLRYIMEYEKMISSSISYYFCEEYGNSQEQYLNRDNYNTTGKYAREINKLIRKLNKVLEKSNGEYPYLEHYKMNYHNVPLWVLINACSMGIKKHMFNVLPQEIQSKISKEFDLTPNIVSSINELVTKFRNTAAHGGRLYNKKINESLPDLSIHAKLKISKKGEQYEKGKSDLFAIVIALKYVLPNEQFFQFKKLLAKCIDNFLEDTVFVNKETILNLMGFPLDWGKITRYKK